MYKYTDGAQRMKAEEILDDLKRYNGTIDFDLVKKQVLGLQMSSPQFKQRFARNIDILKAKATAESVRGSAPCLPLPEKRKGDILIGNLIQGSKEFGPMCLPIDTMTHSLALGATGTGKSNLEWNIIIQIVERGSNALVFDRKREARNVLDEVKIPILEAHDLKQNLFEPPCPEINQRQWIWKVLDLTSIWGLYWSSRNYIKESVIGVLEDTGDTPTLYDVFSEIKFQNERGETRKRYQEASLNKVENVVEEIGPILGNRRSFPLTELFSTPLVIEVDKLSLQSERFFIAYLILSLLEIRKARSIRGNPGLDRDSAFVFYDESATLFSPQMDFSEKTREMGFDILQEIPLVARDYKICLFFGSQIPLSKTIMANVRTQFVSQLTDAEDAWRTSNSIGVEQEVFQMLGVGEFVVKSGNLEAFAVRTKKIERRPIDEKTLQDLKRPFIEYIKSKTSQGKKKIETATADNRIRLDEISKKFLVNVASRPSLTVTQRYDELTLKGRTAQDVKQSLINQKLVEEVFLAIGSSKLSTFLVPTQKTVDYLKSTGIECRFYKHVGKTSPLHQLIQAMVIAFFEGDGWGVKNDVAVADKFVDVLIEKDSKIVIEVAVNPTIDTERVKSALGLVDQYMILAADITVLKSLEKSVEPLKSEKVRIFLATNFLARLRRGVLDNYIESSTEQNQNNQNNGKPRPEDGEQEENRSNQQVG